MGDYTNRTGSSLRTLVASLLGTTAWSSSRCVLIWKPQVTPYNRLLFRLSPSMLRTDEIESGLLATPNTMDRIAPKTPKAVKREMEVTRKGRSKFANLKEQIPYGLTLQSGNGTGLKLQPGLVEWMMGYPTGHTALKPSATP